MNYFTWEQLCAKYKKMAQDFDATAVNSFWAPTISSELDSMLAKGALTVPFTPTPLSITNLAIDLCYWEMTYKEEDQSQLKDWIDERITGIVNGTIILVGVDGTVQANPQVFLTTSGTNTSFGMDNPVNFAVDSSWQRSFMDQRGQC